MNPPTPGHLRLIRQLIEKAIEINVQTVYLVLSKTNDTNEDPIHCQLKIDVLRGPVTGAVNGMISALKTQMKRETVDIAVSAKIDDTNVIPICVPEEPRASPFTAVGKLIQETRERLNAAQIGPTQEPADINLFIIIGEDRADLVDSISNFYYEKDVNIFSINAKVLSRDNMDAYKQMTKPELEALNMSDVPADAFSATFVRKIVNNNLRDKFRDVYRPYLDADLTEVLFAAIQAGLRKLIKKSNTKSVKKSVTSKNTYPKVKMTEKRTPSPKEKEPSHKKRKMLS